MHDLADAAAIRLLEESDLCGRRQVRSNQQRLRIERPQQLRDDQLQYTVGVLRIRLGRDAVGAAGAIISPSRSIFKAGCRVAIVVP